MANWFRQKLESARLHRSNRHGNVCAAAYEHNGRRNSGVFEFIQVIQTALARQPDVQHQATRTPIASTIDKCLNRREGINSQSNGADEIVERVTDFGVVVNNYNNSRLLTLYGPSHDRSCF